MEQPDVDVAGLLEGRPEIFRDLVHDARVARAVRLTQDPGGLVDGDQVVILVDYLEHPDTTPSELEYVFRSNDFCIMTRVTLPILDASEIPPERRSAAGRYGALFYLAAVGLVVLVGLIGVFAWKVWTLREVWGDVYRLNDPDAPVAARLAAGDRLAENPDFSDRQRLELALSRVPPPPARYRLAVAIGPSILADDPSAYAMMVARSVGWPNWLRLALVRPLAYDDGRHAFPTDATDRLRRHDDPAIRLWTAYVLAVGRDDPGAIRELTESAMSDGPYRGLANLLQSALDAKSDPIARLRFLDRATDWLTRNHPDVPM